MWCQLTYVDPVSDLDVFVGRVKMKTLRLIAVFHLVAARQLHVKLHLGRAEHVKASPTRCLFSPLSSFAVVPVDATASMSAH